MWGAIRQARLEGYRMMEIMGGLKLKAVCEAVILWAEEDGLLSESII